MMTQIKLKSGANFAEQEFEGIFKEYEEFHRGLIGEMNPVLQRCIKAVAKNYLILGYDLANQDIEWEFKRVLGEAAYDDRDQT